MMEVYLELYLRSKHRVEILEAEIEADKEILRRMATLKTVSLQRQRAKAAKSQVPEAAIGEGSPREEG